MDYEKCRLMCYKVGEETHCDNLGIEDLRDGNFTWVMTNDVTRCCFEVCSDQDCYSKKASIGINDCTSCKNDRDCNLVCIISNNKLGVFGFKQNILQQKPIFRVQKVHFYL